jgi:hypothetical protein
MISQEPAAALAASSAALRGRARRALPGAGRLWPWAPALLLGSLLGTELVVLWCVLDDPTFSFESDYYRKAVDWDARRARQRQSDQLGWLAQASAATSASGSVLSVRLLDARGAAICGAQVHAIAFHNARAARELAFSLHEESPGLYRAPLGSTRAGLWEVRLSATRALDVYESTLRFEVAPEGSKR